MGASLPMNANEEVILFRSPLLVSDYWTKATQALPLLSEFTNTVWLWFPKNVFTSSTLFHYKRLNICCGRIALRPCMLNAWSSA